MHSKTKLLKEIPLAEFFRERVKEATVKHQVMISSIAEFYVVNLLQEFKKVEKLFVQEGNKMMEKPLALLLIEAVEGDLNTKIRNLKKLGDLALYTAGFFQESVEKKPVPLNYYINMGGGAYKNLADLLSRQQTFSELYSELSNLFPDLVSVLSDIALNTETRSNQDLLKLYERWLETKDNRLENLLKEAGIALGDQNIFSKIQ